MSSKHLLRKLPGLREFFPDDWAEINFILEKMRETCVSYNYLEYEGPSLEPIEIYEAKSGEGLVGEVYHVHDADGNHLVLRPEQTPTLSKMVGREQQRFTKPLRWFSIPRLFRDEAVQKGRSKEFWQLNVDLLGEPSLGADAEVIAVAAEIIRACGADDSQFEILVNHRGLLNSFLTGIGVDTPSEVISTIDKKMKLVQVFIEEELVEGGADSASARNQAMQIRKLLNASGEYLDKLRLSMDDTSFAYISRKEEIITNVLSREFRKMGFDDDTIKKVLDFTSVSGRGDRFFDEIDEFALPDQCLPYYRELEELAKYLDGYGVLPVIRFDLSLARGLDYYTGVVFEAFDSTGNIVRALCGGGRYDNLVEALGGDPLTGVGFGMGDLALLEFLRTTVSSFGGHSQKVDIYIAPIKPEVAKDALDIARDLRKYFRVLCNPFKWKMKRHLNAADTSGATAAVFIGPRDVKNGVVSLRKMADGTSQVVPRENILEHLRSIFT